MDLFEQTPAIRALYELTLFEESLAGHPKTTISIQDALEYCLLKLRHRVQGLESGFITRNDPNKDTYIQIIEELELDQLTLESLEFLLTTISNLIDVERRDFKERIPAVSNLQSLYSLTIDDVGKEFDLDEEEVDSLRDQPFNELQEHIESMVSDQSEELGELKDRILMLRKIRVALKTKKNDLMAAAGKFEA